MKYSLYSISERTPTRIVISRNRSIFLRNFVFYALFLIGWLAGILQSTNNNHSIAIRVVDLLFNPFQWTFLAAAVWLAYKALKDLFLFFTGDQMVINKSDNCIIKQKGAPITITDLECLQIRKYVDSDNAEDYRLSFVKNDGEKVFIDRSSDKEGIFEFAEEIADFIGKPIKIK